uniref:Putative F-box protein CPR30-like n=1 Tax=Davidia involucrata TaxID=16924 RepID=A0A5B7BYL5_DAVIN
MSSTAKALKVSTSATTIQSIHGLPQDIIADIFSRLPVKYLLRFSCASKQSHLLISDPQFIKTQLNRTNEIEGQDINHRLRYGVLGFGGLPGSLSLSSVNYEASDHSSTELTHPSTNSRFYPEILGSCNGLLLVGLGGHTLVLWNPSIRKSDRISCSYHKYYEDRFRLYGLGYDSSINQYKVVSAVAPIRRHRYGFVDDHHGGMRTTRLHRTKVAVFNFKSTSSSRRVQEVPYKIASNAMAAVVNGAPHWVVSRGGEDDDYVIVYFDFVEEKLKEVPKPRWLDDITSKLFDLGVLKGCLCAVINDGVKGNSEVWVMKDYGMKESWTELIVIPSDCRWSRDKPFGFGRLVPLGLKKNGEFLMVADRARLIVYNPRKNTMEDIMLTQNDRFHGAPYVESLVSPHHHEGDYGIIGEK